MDKKIKAARLAESKKLESEMIKLANQLLKEQQKQHVKSSLQKEQPRKKHGIYCTCEINTVSKAKQYFKGTACKDLPQKARKMKLACHPDKCGSEYNEIFAALNESLQERKKYC